MWRFATICLILLLTAAAALADCNVLPIHTLTGYVLHHKRSAPYPLATKNCGTWESKIVISTWEWDPEGYWEEYRYFGYPIRGVTTCTRAGAAIPCADIKDGEKVRCVYAGKTKSPHRGQLASCEVLAQ